MTWFSGIVATSIADRTTIGFFGSFSLGFTDGRGEHRVKFSSIMAISVNLSRIQATLYRESGRQVINPGVRIGGSNYLGDGGESEISASRVLPKNCAAHKATIRHRPLTFKTIGTGLNDLKDQQGASSSSNVVMPVY